MSVQPDKRLRVLKNKGRKSPTEAIPKREEVRR
jgi:hypothetical protein